MASIADANKKVLDFDEQLEAQDEFFPTLKLLDNDGKLLDKAAYKRSELTDEDLVEIMKKMLFSRQLDIRSTKLAKQGRFGFFAPTAGQEASQMASAYAFGKEDWLFPGYRDIPEIDGQYGRRFFGHVAMLKEMNLLQKMVNQLTHGCHKSLLVHNMLKQLVLP